MHSDCWQKYFDSVLAKERRRPIRFRHHLPFDVDRQEFLCPLCECLSNTVLPIVTQNVISNYKSTGQVSDGGGMTISCDEWLRGLQFAFQQTAIAMMTPLDHRHGDETKSPEVTRICNLENVVAHLGPSAGEQFQKMFSNINPDPDNPDNCEFGATASDFSESLLEMMKIFTQTCYTTGLGSNPNYEDNRVALMTYWSCTYTIHAIESLLRDQGKPLFGELSTRQSDCLSALVRVASVCSATTNAAVLQSHAIRLADNLLVNPGKSANSITDVDAFGAVVSLCFLLPYLFTAQSVVADSTDSAAAAAMNNPADNSTTPPPLFDAVRESHIVTLIYAMHVVQILLTVDPVDPQFSRHSTGPGDSGDPMDTEVSVDELALQELLALVRDKCGSRCPKRAELSPFELQEFVQQRSVPFLRCCAIFFHYLTNVPAPPSLRDPLASEFEPLATYMALPNMAAIWASPMIKDLIQRWLSHKSLSAPSIPHRVMNPLVVNQLVRLPRDYSELINSVSLFTCPKSDGDDSRTPTMCLVCGEVLCSQSYCCQTDLDGMMVGACTYHAHFCGAGVGVFLRVRECKVLLLTGRTKGCFVSPPYLDDYGETDQGLRRGNPLHLCSERYKKLHKMWLSHGIPEEIAHALESNANILSTEWHNL